MTKTNGKPVAAAAAPTLIVLGYDEHHKPRAARFTGVNPGLVAKAAQAMNLDVRQATSPELVEIAKKLPVGRLYANGKGFVPNVRQALYSKVIATLAVDAPQGQTTGEPNLPAAQGLPRTWDEIAPGHLVIAQETLEYGWWEQLDEDAALIPRMILLLRMIAQMREADSPPAPLSRRSKVGRNDPCPCGSGKKYKRCCGAS